MEKTEQNIFFVMDLATGEPIEKEGECRENVETAYLYYDLCVLGKWANDQKDKERENWAKACAERVKREYNQSLLQKDESGIWYYGGKGELEKGKNDGKSGASFYLGMVPEDKEKDVKQTFLDLAEKGKIQSGEICLRYIFCMLSQYGKNESIEKMIMQKDSPVIIGLLKKVRQLCRNFGQMMPEVETMI